jgi:hypothetical protein
LFFHPPLFYPGRVHADQAVLLQVLLHHPADRRVGAGKPFLHQLFPFVRSGDHYHAPAVSQSLPQDFITSALGILGIFHGGSNPVQELEDLQNVFRIMQQNRFRQSSRCGTLLELGTQAPSFHCSQEAAHVHLAQALERHGHAFAQPPARVGGIGTELSQDFFIALRQQPAQSEHAAKGQEFVRIVDRGELGRVGQEMFERFSVAFVGDGLGQLQVAARTRQPGFLQEVGLPILQGFQFLAIAVGISQGTACLSSIFRFAFGYFGNFLVSFFRNWRTFYGMGSSW